MKEYINEEGFIYNSFIYIWFDKLKNKYYIGSHVGDVNDKYLFGGIDIKNEYKERREDFSRKIIQYCLIKEYHEIRDIEKFFLVENDVENNSKFYNRTNESYGGCHIKSVERRLLDIDENGKNHFQRSSIKMVKTRKEKNSYKTAKIKEYATKQINKENYENIKKKISDTLMGSRWVNKNGSTKLIKNNEYDNYISNGWIEGRVESLSYNDCKKLAVDNNIKSIIQWKKYAKSSEIIPSHPDRKFKHQWINWYEFLEKERK